MESKEVKLLSDPSNFAIVLLPERRYPGVVFQGDSLHNLLQNLQRVHAMATKSSDRKIAEELQFLIDDLIEVKQKYEYICQREKTGLPY